MPGKPRIDYFGNTCYTCQFWKEHADRPECEECIHFLTRWDVLIGWRLKPQGHENRPLRKIVPKPFV